jgi:hypothetical protein
MAREIEEFRKTIDEMYGFNSSVLDSWRGKLRSLGKQLMRCMASILLF